MKERTTSYNSMDALILELKNKTTEKLKSLSAEDTCDERDALVRSMSCLVLIFFCSVVPLLAPPGLWGRQAPDNKPP